MRRREYKNFWRNCKLHYILNLVKTKLCPAVYTKTAYHFINLIKLCSMIDKFSIILTFNQVGLLDVGTHDILHYKEL